MEECQARSARSRDRTLGRRRDTRFFGYSPVHLNTDPSYVEQVAFSAPKSHKPPTSFHAPNAAYC